MDVHPRKLMDALFASAVTLEERPDAGGVLVTWRFQTDVLRAMHGSVAQSTAIIRQFLAPRSVLLAQDFWRREADPLVVDSPLSGWVDQDGAILWRTSPDWFESHYRVVSRSYEQALEARFPRLAVKT